MAQHCKNHVTITVKILDSSRFLFVVVPVRAGMVVSEPLRKIAAAQLSS